MLDQLDAVQWSELTHAYGFASDVPSRIRALGSSDAKVRENALWELYGNIFHQGTRYEATPYAVPFLYELVDAPSTSGREQIIYLLVNIALGYEEAYLPGGVDAKAFVRHLEDADARMSSSDREECHRYGLGPRIDLACYLSVQDGAPVFMRLLDDVDTDVRQAAIYGLAWFPSIAADSLPRLQRRLRSERSDVGLANVVLSIGLLARGAREERTLTDFGVLLTHSSSCVRTAAAIALACDPLDEAVLGILIEAVMSPESLQSVEGLPFNEGNLAGYASLALSSGGASARARVIPALCETLEKVSPYQKLDITRALLDLIFAGKQTPISDISAHSFDSVERAGLHAIVQNGAWKVNGATFANYCQLVGAYGLPTSRDEMLEFLGHR